MCVAAYLPCVCRYQKPEGGIRSLGDGAMDGYGPLEVGAGNPTWAPTSIPSYFSSPHFHCSAEETETPSSCISCGWRGCTHRILFSTMTIYQPSRLSTHLLPLYPTHSSPKLPLLRPSNSAICQHGLSHQPRKRCVRFDSLTVTSHLSLPWEGPALLHPPSAMARKRPPDSCFSHGPCSCFLVYTVCKRLACISGWVIRYFTAKGKFLWPLIFHAQKSIAQVSTVTLPP